MSLRDAWEGEAEAWASWASTPGQLAAMLSGCEITWMRAWQLGHGLRKLGVPVGEVPERFGFLGMALPWQKVLARKPS